MFSEAGKGQGCSYDSFCMTVEEAGLPGAVTGLTDVMGTPVAGLQGIFILFIYRLTGIHRTEHVVTGLFVCVLYGQHMRESEAMWTDFHVNKLLLSNIRF